MTKSPYNHLNSEMIAKLEAIVGPENVESTDTARLEALAKDETPGLPPHPPPEAAVRPATAAEIAEIMKLANKWRVPVTPRGAGSGLSGGAVPLYGGILILMDRFDKILEIDEKNMMATVEPGIISNDINERLAPLGLFHAGYPMSLETCQIGGNIAENAGGGKAIKYGVTSRYVLGLEVVTPTGDIIELGGKILKDVTGYNLLQLMVGSEGTLGIVTKIILRLVPLPKHQVDLLCLFDSLDAASEAVPAIMTECGITPSSLEFMDILSFKTACGHLRENIPVGNAEAALIVSVDGHDKKRVQEDYLAVGEFCEKRGAFEIFVADNPATSERIWKIRRTIPEAFAIMSDLQRGEDVVVPPASIPAATRYFADLAERHGVIIPCYGHAGDGNLHVRITAPAEWPRERWNKELPDILDQIHSFVAKLGGTLTGEHGVGLKHKQRISIFLSKEEIAISKAIKNAFDPNNILNPGKIFPE